MSAPAPALPFLADLQAAFDAYAGRQVQAAVTERDQRITVLQGQLTAAQALASQQGADLTKAQQQLAQAQAALSAALAADQQDRAAIAAQQQTIAALQAQVAALQPGKAPAPPAGWVEAFRDDFNGSMGPYWTATTDAAGNELSQRLPANVLTAADRLTIRAMRQTYGSRQFTSGYITTAGHASWQFFRALVRARWDDVFGVWPAIWFRFDNAAGEIDGMEAVGTVPLIVQTVHQNTNGQQDKSGFEWHPPAGWKPSDWHVYGLQRDNTGTLTWTIDGQVTRTVTRTDLGLPSRTPMTWLTGPQFAGPAHMIANLQVGGRMVNWYVNGDATKAVDPARILPAGQVANFELDYAQVVTPLAAA